MEPRLLQTLVTESTGSPRPRPGAPAPSGHARIDEGLGPVALDIGIGVPRLSDPVLGRASRARRSGPARRRSAPRPSPCPDGHDEWQCRPAGGGPTLRDRVRPRSRAMLRARSAQARASSIRSASRYARLTCMTLRESKSPIPLARGVGRVKHCGLFSWGDSRNHGCVLRREPPFGRPRPGRRYFTGRSSGGRARPALSVGGTVDVLGDHPHGCPPRTRGLAGKGVDVDTRSHHGR
jgi:hypothetical protein